MRFVSCENPPNQTTMKRTTSTLLAATLLFGVVSIKVNAQTGPNRKPFGTGELPEFLKAYDLNDDGKLSVEERQAYEKALRDARPPRPGMKNPWDTNDDGVLSDAEKQAAREAIAAKMLEERTKRFNELDVDKDGLLTSTELKAIPRIADAQVADMIAHLDTAGTDGTKDGMISLAEFLAAMVPVQPPVQTGVPPLPMPGAPVPPWLKALDTDNNGILSLAEIHAAADANKDGR
jgi:Ca2+-binding EF-hand superfamily protein